MARKSIRLSEAGAEIDYDDAKHKTINAKSEPVDQKSKSKYPLSESSTDRSKPSRLILNLKLDLGTADQFVDPDDVHLRIPYEGQREPFFFWWDGKKWEKFELVTYNSNVANITLPKKWPTDPMIGGNP
jgi:hypothetical protein